MRDLGLHVRVDGIGNVVATMAGATDGPPVMCGSHIDTVRTGGRYDGNLGVLAGLEVIETVLRPPASSLERPLAVGFFTDEEGVAVPAGHARQPRLRGWTSPLEQALGIEGDRRGDRAGEPSSTRIGYLGDRAGARPPRPTPSSNCTSSRDPVLEAAGRSPSARVSGVQGISWAEITVTGQSNHAGTTPMAHAPRPRSWWRRRRHRVRPRARRPPDGTYRRSATVGPASTCIPAWSTSCPRHGHPHGRSPQHRRGPCPHRKPRPRSPTFLAGAGRAARVLARSALARLARFEPVEFDDPRIVDLVAETVAREHSATIRAPDALGRGPRCPDAGASVSGTAMIFVPSRDADLSHNPAEHTHPRRPRGGRQRAPPHHDRPGTGGVAVNDSAADVHHMIEVRRVVRVAAGQLGPIAARRDSQGGRRPPPGAAPPGRRRRAVTSSCSPSSPSPRSSPGGGHRRHRRPRPLLRDGRCPGPDTRPLFDEARSRLGVGFCLGYAELTPERSSASTPTVLVDRNGSNRSAGTARSTSPATTRTSPGVPFQHLERRYFQESDGRVPGVVRGVRRPIVGHGAPATTGAGPRPTGRWDSTASSWSLIGYNTPDPLRPRPDPRTRSRGSTTTS